MKMSCARARSSRLAQFASAPRCVGGAFRSASLGVLTLFLLLSLGWIGIGIGQNESGSIQLRRRQLEDLKGEIETNRGQIETLRQREAEKSEVSSKVEKDAELTRRYLAELGKQERDLREVQSSRQTELLDKEVAVSETAARLEKRLLRYYKLRHVTGGELVFSAGSFSEVFARSQFLVRIIEKDRIDLVALAQDRAAIVAANEQLEVRRIEIDGLLVEKRAEEKRLARLGEDVQKEIAGIQGARSAQEKRLEELRATESSIRGVLNSLEEARVRARERGGRPSFQGDLAGHKGDMHWPVRGKVVAEFGYIVHPKYNTKVPQNGIVISAPTGTLIEAAAPGVVEFVDWYDGYGRTVILNHGNGYYSLYAHASAVLVGRGDRIETGQAIAEVGDTDSLRGSCLHFEVRHQQEALDPRDWLGP